MRGVCEACRRVGVCGDIGRHVDPGSKARGRKGHEMMYKYKDKVGKSSVEVESQHREAGRRSSVIVLEPRASSRQRIVF